MTTGTKGLRKISIGIGDHPACTMLAALMVSLTMDSIIWSSRIIGGS